MKKLKDKKLLGKFKEELNIGNKKLSKISKTKLKKIKIKGNKPILKINLEPKKVQSEKSIFFKIENIK